MKLPKNWNFKILVWFIKKNKLKNIYKIIFVLKQSPRDVVQERCSANMKQESNNAEARSQRSHFTFLLKSHPRTDAPPKGPQHIPWILSSRRAPLADCFACQNKFKRLESYVLSFPFFSLCLLDFNYCQNNKAQWKNRRAFLKLLDTIIRYLLFLFIYLSMYSFLVLINFF